MLVMRLALKVRFGVFRVPNQIKPFKFKRKCFLHERKRSPRTGDIVLPSWMLKNEPDCPLAKPVTSLPAYPILSNPLDWPQQYWGTRQVPFWENIVTSLIAWFRSLLNDFKSTVLTYFANPIKSHVYGPISPVLDDLFPSGKRQFDPHVRPICEYFKIIFGPVEILN